MVIALIMAGGKGTRIKLNCEKPLVKINKKPMIDHVINNIEHSENIKSIYIATSPHTPLTREYLFNKGYNIIETPGNGYIRDLNFLLAYFEKKFPEHILLTISSDLPCVDSDLIEYILKEYENEYKKSSKPAMCVSVPVEVFKKYDLKPSIVLDGRVPSGVNILRSINKIQDEEVLEVPKIELALNINTCQDIKVFEKFFGDNDGRKETD